MLKRWHLLLIPVLVLGLLAGCSDDETTAPVATGPTPAEQFALMAAAGEAYINDSAACPGVMSADALQAERGTYTVIDIRSAAAYDAGHIDGAYNSSLATLLDDLASGAIPTDKNIVLACYSGQSAGHAKVALEMIYPDLEIYSLGFGMSSWNEELAGSWNNSVGDQLVAPSVTAEALVDVHDFPTIETGVSADEDVVPARVAWMLGEGFKGISYSTVAADPDNYFVVNYFGLDDYMGNGSAGVPGHIPGAYQYTPYASMGTAQLLEYLPTDKEIVVYCWTGQHSSQVTAYLNMLGYTAWSLKNGSNSLFHSDLTAHKWTAASTRLFPLEMTMTAPFEAVATAAQAYVNSVACPGVISATLVHDNLDDYTVVDIRSTTDFALGHIPGAIHSSLATLMADLDAGTIPVNKDIVVACYSGQSAGHAKVALEMLVDGVDIYSLKWGMCSWNSATSGSWNGGTNTGDNLANPSTESENAGLTRHAYPKLADTTTATALEDRVAAMLAGGFQGIGYTEIQNNLDEYFIINYFGEADYLGEGGSGVPGHIPGAYQFTPGVSLSLDEMLKRLPTDKEIVVYCWTGQTSSQITAYLNMLGYTAYSLKFGSNNLFYSDLTAHKWSANEINEFELVTE